MTRPIGAAGDEQSGQTGDRELGVDPATGHAVWLKTGRFGPYVEELATPAKRASLPKDWPPATVDLDRALRLLRLPREVGPHPEDGAMILAGVGRYGPYVQHNGVYANLPTADEVFDLGINRAVAALAEKATGGGRRPRAAGALKELGAHPTTGDPVRLLAGRFGPYVKHGATNANLPKGADPEGLTLEEAVALLTAREGATTKSKRTPRKAKASASKASATKRPRPVRARAKSKA
jgi:DNA topoisomerase-1